MKHYFYSAVLVLSSILFITILPIAVQSTQDLLISYQVPANNSDVAGVSKINLPPISLNIQVPFYSAKAVLVKDLTSGSVLYQKNASSRLPIASTTKIMTALTSSEYFAQNTVLTVSQAASIGGSTTGLYKGEVISFRSLLYGMLLNSGNDAAFAIAENYPGGVVGFVSAMNKKVAQLNLKNTHFDNPAGFDSSNHFSSAFDLAKITEESLKNSNLTRVFSTKDTEVFSWDKKYKHQLHNLNKLLSQVSGVLGVKTGYTEQAKENLVTLVDRKGHKILVVVLGSEDRFGESTNLIEWAYQNFTWSDQGIVQ
ncbi:D-alanyl-D-alanine carboxypeptidase [Candidatus Daviesbacteria bacterium]|nr:D-alanyl-D-alanine carboxypeptidase [Candidatus Daviesbacteria bacterium]